MRLRVTDRNAFEPYRVGIAMRCSTVSSPHPRLKTMLLAGKRPSEIFASWSAEVEAFRWRSTPYHLYH